MLDSVDSRTTFQPDALVYRGERLPRGSIEARDPVIVIEVLSPSTRAVDMRIKVQRYFSVASIQHYLILDPNDQTVIHHARSEGDALITRIVSEGELRLAPPGLFLDARDLFPPD